MYLRYLLSVYGILSAVGGVIWIAVPGTVLSLFGVASADSVATLLATLFGAGALGLGVLAWFARHAAPSEGRDALVLGLTVTNLLWFVLILLGVFSGEYNIFAWIPAVAYGVWTLLFVIAVRTGREGAVPGVAG